MSFHHKNFPQIQCQGRMEGLSVKDLSPSAGLFQDKFSVLGNEVLQVNTLYANFISFQHLQWGLLIKSYFH